APATASSRLAGVLISTLLVAAVGGIERAAGGQTSFTLLYLLPIAVAVWWAGRNVAVAVCICAALIGLANSLRHQPSLPIVFWNAGAKLGVYLAFCILLNQFKISGDGASIRSKLPRFPF